MLGLVKIAKERVVRSEQTLKTRFDSVWRFLSA